MLQKAINEYLARINFEPYPYHTIGKLKQSNSENYQMRLRVIGPKFESKQSTKELEKIEQQKKYNTAAGPAHRRRNRYYRPALYTRTAVFCYFSGAMQWIIFYTFETQNYTTFLFYVISSTPLFCLASNFLPSCHGDASPRKPKANA